MTTLALLLAAQELTPEPIREPVRTWYRVLETDEHVGYVEESIEPKGTRFLYYWRLETWGEDPVEFRAELDAQFEIVTLTGPGVEVWVDASLKRKVRAGGRTEDLAGIVHLPLALLQRRQQGTLDSRETLKVFREQDVTLIPLRSVDRQTKIEIDGRGWASVDRYGRAIELTIDGRTVRFSKTKEEAQAGHVVAEGRRDPFDKNQLLRRKGKDEPASGRSASETIDAVNARADRVLKTLDERDYAEYLRAYAPVRGHRDLAAKKREVERVYGGARKLLERPSGLDGLKKLRGRPEFDEADDAVEDLETLVATLQARLDLESMKLRLTATMIAHEEGTQAVDVEFAAFGCRVRLREDVPFSRAVSYATINGRPVRLGDRVEGLTVVEITRYGATVSRAAEGRVPELLRELPLR